MGLVDSIIGAESGGNASAANPNSSAVGLGQFIAPTWIDTLSRERPDLVQGKSREEILALRTDPDLSRQMTEAYAKQNGEILSNAGVPVTPGNTYLAHFAGPQGAVKLLQADPNTPVEQILGPAAMKANPFLAGKTAADLGAWADKKMGGAQSQPPQQTAQASPSAPAMMPPQQPGPPLSIQPNLAPQVAPIFAQQAQAPQQSGGGQQAAFAPPQQMQPIFAPQRKPVDISRLRAALAAAQQRGPIFGQG